MTTTATKVPAPPCSGEFHLPCSECGGRTHPAPATGPNRVCDQGHQPFVGKGCCRRCYYRIKRGSAQTAPKPPGWTPVPPELRDTVPAPCDRCGQIERLRMGPGEALCTDCGHAQLLDMEASRDGLALARGGAS